jgi:ABC-type nitrate/sulfonate/bicarbonate transport system permease component
MTRAATTAPSPAAQRPAVAGGAARPSFWRREVGPLAWLAIATGSVVATIAVWAYVTREGGPVSPLSLPSPSEVASSFLRLARRPYLGSTLAQHVMASLSVAIGGWLAAGIVVLRPVPPLAWIPLAILWLGIGQSARVFVVFIAAVVPWVMNSMQAVYSIDGILVRAAMTLGANDRQILTRVVCRTALPTLIAGARIALGNAWTTLVAAELLAATAGLGYIAVNASRTLETGILLVAMLVIGVLGAAMSVGMQGLARLVAPWSRAQVQA